MADMVSCEPPAQYVPTIFLVGSGLRRATAIGQKLTLQTPSSTLEIEVSPSRKGA
jgi:hypothetical protein